MGETIHRLVLAAISLTFVASGSLCYGQANGMQIPDSLKADLGGGNVNSAASNSLRSTTPPDFTAGTVERATTLSNGPNTDPVQPNRQKWIPETPAASRPSTEPFLSGANPNASPSARPASTDSANSSVLRNLQNQNTGQSQLGQSQLGTTSRGSSLPPSSSLSSSPMGGPETNNQSSSKLAGGATASFGMLPDNISLPPRNVNDRLQSQAMQGQSSAATNAAGPSSAFDFSMYGTDPTSGRRTTAATPTGTAVSSIGQVGVNGQAANASLQNSQAAGGQGGLGQGGLGAFNNSRSNVTLGSNQATSSGSSMGMPGTGSINAATPGLGLPTSEVFPKPNSYETTWTSQQIAELASKFGIAADDPVLRRPEYVNKLYEQFDQYRQEQRLKQQQLDWQRQYAGQNTTSNPSASTLLDKYGYPRSAVGGTLASGQPQAFWPGQQGVGQQGAGQQGNGQFPYPTNNGSSNGVGGVGYGVNDPSATNQDSIVDSRRQRSGTSKKLFDENGFPVDGNGNILDQYGNPVDETTAAAMVARKLMQQQMDEWKKSQEDLLKRMNPQVDPNSRIADARLADGRSAVNTVGQQGRSNTTSSGNSSTAPNSNLSNEPTSPSNQSQQDLAGMSPGNDVTRKSNPYVNVFLLCSLVSNAFLLTWLHRLWQNHRDLIASSRMSSGSMAAGE